MHGGGHRDERSPDADGASHGAAHDADGKRGEDGAAVSQRVRRLGRSARRGGGRERAPSDPQPQRAHHRVRLLDSSLVYNTHARIQSAIQLSAKSRLPVPWQEVHAMCFAPRHTHHIIPSCIIMFTTPACMALLLSRTSSSNLDSWLCWLVPCPRHE